MFKWSFCNMYINLQLFTKIILIYSQGVLCDYFLLSYVKYSFRPAYLFLSLFHPLMGCIRGKNDFPKLRGGGGHKTPRTFYVK